jgi:hypothetical protein
MIREWLASLLVLIGVIVIAYGAAHDVPLAPIGAIPLTIGVRLAIDCGKAGR